MSQGSEVEIPLVVAVHYHGYRLDRFIAARIARLSRTRIQTIIRSGKVCLQDQTPITQPAWIVHSGDVLILRRPFREEPETPQSFTIIYQDRELLVIDKPAGLPVHPTARYYRHTLTYLLRERWGEQHGWELAHRLDRETSGLLLLGRRGESARRLKHAFLQRRVHKCYKACVHGILGESHIIRLPLGADPQSKIHIKIAPLPMAQGGVEAVTQVRPLQYGQFRGQPITLIEAIPHTGRQHQIRVHVAAIGHGLVGDKLYGIDEKHFLDMIEGRQTGKQVEQMLGISRHALHASYIEFLHPSTGQKIHFEAPWPNDLATVLVPE